MTAARRHFDPRGALGLPVLIGAALTIFFLGLFAVALENVAAKEGEGLAALDGPAARFFAAHRSGGLTGLMKILTKFGGVAFTVAVTVLVVSYLLFRAKDVVSATFLAVVVAAGDVSYVAIKVLVHRQRPQGGLAGLSTYSFPSGHAVGATVLFGGLAFIMSPRLRSGAAKAAVWVGALLIAALVDVTRVYLGVHYASDVIGGTLLGAAWVAAGATALVAWDRSWREPPAWRPTAPN